MKASLYSGITFFMILLSFYGNAQKERNVWCFGYYSEINFNGGGPVAAANCKIGSAEGCASIADKTTGQLLFYSDGTSVYDTNNDVMPGNTIPLGGNTSTSQSAYILPRPGSNHEYYLFCTDAQGGEGGTQYTI